MPSRLISSSWLPSSTIRPRFEHGDPVGVAHRDQVVRDHDRGAPAHQPPQRAHDPAAGLGVDARRRLVEDEHRSVPDHRPGDRDPLALPTRQPPALLADLGLVAVGKRGDELVRVGGDRRRLDLLAGGVAGARRRCSRRSSRRRPASPAAAARRCRAPSAGSGPAGPCRRARSGRNAGRRSAAAASPASTCRRRSGRPARAPRLARPRARRPRPHSARCRGSGR